MKETTKLKYWLDAELSILHAFLWAILGAIIGGKFWYIAGLGIAVSLVYAVKRTMMLPRDYLRIPKGGLRKALNERD